VPTRSVAMRPERYREIRKAVGTQQEVAKMLDVSRATLWARETGKWPVSTETALAMKWLLHLKTRQESAEKH
jgi:DNA-binding XRE family transcriptional regulator